MMNTLASAPLFGPLMGSSLLLLKNLVAQLLVILLAARVANLVASVHS